MTYTSGTVDEILDVLKEQNVIVHWMRVDGRGARWEITQHAADRTDARLVMDGDECLAYARGVMAAHNLAADRIEELLP